MSREMHNPRMPGLFEQLSVLPPSVQIAAGILMVSMGVAGIVMTPDSYYAWVLLIVGLAIGCPLAFQGMSKGREARVEAEEMERAKAELDELKLVVSDAAEGRRGIERVLMKRGYTSAKVRRWIALECDIVLPRRDV